MKPSPDNVTRRTLLRSASAAICLPWLESLAAAGGRTTAPVRLAFLFMPNGVLPAAWTPKEQGDAWQPSGSLTPLAALRDEVLVLSGLYNKNSLTGEGHYVKTCAWLSGAPVHKTGGRDLRVGTSIDQVVARARGAETRVPSLVLGTEAPRNQVDMGYTTVYGAHVSWETPTRPAAKELRPQRAFDRLFRAGRLAGPEGSVLDLVREEARDLASRLGGADRDRLGDYLEALRAVERRLEAFEGPAQLPAGGARPPVDPASHAEHVRLMLDLIALAFRADATRLASFMFGNAVSGRDFRFLEGVEDSHHPLSHHENKPERQEQYERIVRWHVAEVARFLEILAAVPEGEGSLLDHCLIQFGSGIADGNAHDPHDLPLFVAGRGGGAIRPGRHLRYPRHTALCGLYAAMLGASGLPAGPFGDAAGPLPDLG